MDDRSRVAFAPHLGGILADAPGLLMCTRLVYLGPNENVITARSMDWTTDVATNLWILPRGMKRSGEAGAHSFAWTSRYGSEFRAAQPFTFLGI